MVSTSTLQLFIPPAGRQQAQLLVRVGSDWLMISPRYLHNQKYYFYLSLAPIKNWFLLAHIHLVWTICQIILFWSLVLSSFLTSITDMASPRSPHLLLQQECQSKPDTSLLSPLSRLLVLKCLNDIWLMMIANISLKQQSLLHLIHWQQRVGSQFKSIESSKNQQSIRLNTFDRKARASGK